jgi:16S rRNA G966 N2-methylase RsmD
MAPNCIQTSINNAIHCGFSSSTQFTTACGMAEDILLNPTKYNLYNTYDIISLTPPYEEVIYKDLIYAICNSPLIAEDSLVIIEYPEEMGTLPYILGR